MPQLIIVIGANGAGKTTWCRRHGDLLPEHFYNADTIAEGLGGWNSPAHQRAARDLIDERIEGHLTRKEDFGFESTYSGRSRPAIIERAGALGYRTTAIFLGTRRPEINIQRRGPRRDTHRARGSGSRDPPAMGDMPGQPRTHRARDQLHPHARQQRPDDPQSHPHRERP